MTTGGTFWCPSYFRKQTFLANPVVIEPPWVAVSILPPHSFNGLNGKPAQLSLQVLGDPFPYAFTAQTAFLHATKRGRGGGGIDIIDTDATEAQPFKNPHGSGDIPRVDIGGQTVIGITSEPIIAISPLIKFALGKSLVNLLVVRLPGRRLNHM